MIFFPMFLLRILLDEIFNNRDPSDGLRCSVNGCNLTVNGTVLRRKALAHNTVV